MDLAQEAEASLEAGAYQKAEADPEVKVDLGAKVGPEAGADLKARMLAKTNLMKKRKLVNYARIRTFQWKKPQ